jgi:broad specificity phosphatase PhoE
VRLYFARHGESEANVLRVVSNRGRVHPLTVRGREQAERLAALVAGRVARVLSSPLLRAQQTAAIVAERLGGAYRVEPMLAEYDCGVLEGRGDEETWRTHARFFEAWQNGHDRDLAPEGGESFEQIRARFVPFVESLVRVGVGGGVLLVGHGGVYRLMLPLLLPNVTQALARERGFPNTAVVVAESDGAGLRCVEWCGTPVD